MSDQVQEKGVQYFNQEGRDFRYHDEMADAPEAI